VLRLEEELREAPLTSRSSSLLAFLPGLAGPDPLPALDGIAMQTRQWANDSLMSLDFRVYHLLTQALFPLIGSLVQAGVHDAVLFKALSICVRIMPASDRQPLEIVVKLLYRLSQHSQFDGLFLESGILNQILELAFGEYAELSTTAAAMLRHVAADRANAEVLLRGGAVKIICTALRTDVRRHRFGTNLALWVYQVIGLFSTLYNAIEDFALVCRYSLPRSLLDLTTVYSTDIGIQSAVAKAMALMMTREDCVEVVEDVELQPFFILMGSSVAKIASLTALALANAMSLSAMIIDSIVELPPPLGVFGLCELLKTGPGLEVQVSIMRCLAKASATAAGMQTIQLYLHVIDRFLDVQMDELETWTPEQMLVANSLIVLANLARVDAVRAATVMRGKMNQLMVYGIVDYVIDLMRVMMKSEEGLAVCREVRDVTEIRLVLGEF
jgi:hypothetical protein